MQLHLILPGLLWPSQVLRDTASDLELPALSWLLGRGRLSWQPPRAPEAALCHAFGIAADAAGGLPYAALRLLGEAPPGDAAVDDIWMCADPVHLAIEKRRVTLAEEAPTASAAEMDAIVAALAPLLAELDEGCREFRAGRAGRGYLRLARPPAIATTPPSAAAGIDAMLPQGADARRWRQIANEAQMLLHALPLNAQRASRGQPPLNSLWLWGAGALPAAPQPGVGYTAAHGDDPILAGLARWAGTPLQPTATPAELLARRDAARPLVLLDTLRAPARQYDALRWRDALQDVERTWLQPLRRAIGSGRLQRLRITALGDAASLDLELTQRDRLRFWRRPQRLHELPAPETRP